MLVKCPECNHDISDKAVSCPRCGYPMKKQARRQTHRRRRLPNGFGQISKITNQNLRKPYRAMVTVGKSETGKPICKLLQPQAYFETYNEAYEALLEYNKSPSERLAETTLAMVFEKWSVRYFEDYPKTEYKHTHAWSYIKYLGDTCMAELRTKDVRDSIEGRDIAPVTKSDVKNLWNMLFDYALEYDLVDKNYARNYKIPKSERYKSPKDAHKSFTEDEMTILWDKSDNREVQIILIQCYTGFRASELLDVKTSNVRDRFITGGMKTEAGKNRVVPIHPKIADFVKNFKAEGHRTLITMDGRAMQYVQYRRMFDAVLAKYGLGKEHTPHDGRKTFITMAKKCNLNEYAIKYIVGHTITDLTESIYTDRSEEWLYEQIMNISM